MFALAFFFGIYSYLVLALGILGILYKPLVIVITLIAVFLLFLYFRSEKINLKLKKMDKFSKIIISMLAVEAVVNILGVLGPEIGFDALWYHLTLPKIFLSYHKIFHIPGGLFYYSDMPKLGETIYIGALSLGNEILAKFIHFIFGILCLVSIYKVGSKFVSEKLALVACLIFYSNIVVGWESVTAYIDLVRTFFEITAFWAFVEWIEKKDTKFLYESAFILGLAISTKLISVGSLVIFSALIIYQLRHKKQLITKFIFNYWIVAIFVALPWFVFSFVNTGNPIYPIFTKYYPAGLSFNIINPVNFITSIFNIFLKSPDPTSPIYAIVLPLILLVYKKFNHDKYILVIYLIISILVWYLTPQTGGGRFMLVYLPVMSIASVVVINELGRIKSFILFIVFAVAIVFIGYRGIANSKYVPVILGSESKKEFLTKKLNFSFGDFYDVDGYFNHSIGMDDRVLLYGFHNLYYVDFPFIDSSFVKSGDRFNYIAVQNSTLPNRFSFMTPVYFNENTGVTLYSAGGQMWHY